jgi:hypothetical protein
MSKLFSNFGFLAPLGIPPILHTNQKFRTKQNICTDIGTVRRNLIDETSDLNTALHSIVGLVLLVLFVMQKNKRCIQLMGPLSNDP